MAIPQTAVQIAMMMEALEKNAGRWRESFQLLYATPILDMIRRRVILRRPHTDDMMQMLVDLGIEPPERNFTSPDGLTFYFRS